MKTLNNVPRSLIALALAAAALAGCATGGGDPIANYDFRYAMAGDDGVRPYQVYDDGKSTYLQLAGPVDDLHIAVATASGRIDQPITRRGTVLVIPSIARTLVLTQKGSLAEVRYQGPERAPTIRAATTAAATDTSGASADVAASPVQTAAVGAVPLPASTGSATSPAIALAAPPVADQGSALARSFGALAIRQSGTGDAARIQIRFAAKAPRRADPARLSFLAPNGTPLVAQWNADGTIVSLPVIPVVLVTDHLTTVQIERTATSEYRLDPANAAHLEGVFDDNGATYFKFAPSARAIAVTGDGINATGEQKDRFYKLPGVADRFTATADGQSTSVTRVQTVRFSDRVVS
uniref:TrbG/VirB9 family P-type conjugative transfer protein n=1 Tax=Burkholderia arboris TaxID=488730 RepID=UPI003BEF2E08